MLINPARRSVFYGIAGALLSLGAPAGLLLARMSHRRRLSWRMVRREIAADAATYAYVSASTTLAFTLFGTVLGRVADQLALLATSDSMTALLNRRAFEQRLNQEIARAARYGDPLALLLLDVDGLKRINDQHGHAAGDRALQSVADAIRDELRQVDVAARTGGDEFAVLAPRTDPEAAMVLANRIRSRAAERLAAAVGRPCTVSVGTAGLKSSERRTGITAGDLKAAADSALYEAKGQGGNRACSAAAIA